MNARREELDELIDRVAAAMTSAASEPALVERVAGRLDAARATSFHLPRLVFAVVALLIAGATATLVRRGDDRQAPVDVASVAAPTVAAATPPAPESRDVRMQPAGESPPPPVRMITHVREVPPLDPLQSPPLLAIDELSSAPLSVEPVAIEPLDVASLAAAGDQPKE